MILALGKKSQAELADVSEETTKQKNKARSDGLFLLVQFCHCSSTQKLPIVRAKKSPHGAGLNPFLGGDGGDRFHCAKKLAALQQFICIVV